MKKHTTGLLYRIWMQLNKTQTEPRTTYRLWLSALVLILGIGSLRAQILKIGVGTGLLAPFPSYYDPAANRILYQPHVTMPVQVVVDYAFSDAFALQSEVYWQNVRFSYYKTRKGIGYNWDTDQFYSYKSIHEIDYRYSALEMPLLIKWGTGFRAIWLDMMLGPSLGYNLPGTVHQFRSYDQRVTLDENMPIVFKKEGYTSSIWDTGIPMRRFFFNGHGGIQLTWGGPMLTFFANARLIIGISDLLPDARSTANPAALRFLGLSSMCGVLYTVK